MSGARVERNVQNADRVERATNIVMRYENSIMGPSESDQEAVCDILADLQHFCQHESIDFAGCLAMARQHFEAERIQTESDLELASETEARRQKPLSVEELRRPSDEFFAKLPKGRM